MDFDQLMNFKEIYSLKQYIIAKIYAKRMIQFLRLRQVEKRRVEEARALETAKVEAIARRRREIHGRNLGKDGDLKDGKHLYENRTMTNTLEKKMLNAQSSPLLTAIPDHGRTSNFQTNKVVPVTPIAAQTQNFFEI